MALPKITQEINTIKSTYLPLSGGTMTGIINRSGYLARSGNESNILAMISGTDVKHGAGLWLAGNSYSGSVPAGAFRLQCYNPTTQKYTSLTGTNTGSLTWNGGEVITSSGGTMKNTITCSSSYTVAMQKENATSMLTLRSSNDWNGGCIHLWGGNNSGKYPGEVEIIPRTVDSNGTSNHTVFRFRKDGTIERGSTPIHFVVTSWSSGANWYRIWSDGWIEQGGKASAVYTGTLCNLHKAYRDTNYKILVTSSVNAGHAGATYNCSGTCTSTTTMTLCSGHSGAILVHWYACGY